MTMQHKTDTSYVGDTLAGSRPSRASLTVLQALEAAGLEAWFVGGWVRDALMGSHPHDVDMCCSGTWEQSAAALRARGIAVIESGVKFGGVTAVCSGERIEVTAYRVDGSYGDGRHPDDVAHAACIEDDLARRDFTVNAMAWHPARGLLDLYDGRADLARRSIRAVGEPRRRFEEDALRMLRAVRFACRLDFALDAATADALATCAPLLDQVARERVGIELAGILASGHGGDALTRHPELMCAAIPELAPMRGFDQRSRYHAYTVYEHTARVLTVAGELARFRIDGGDPTTPPSPALMWAALLHDVGKPETFTVDERGCGHFYGHPEASARIARAVMRRLSIPGDTVDEACLLITYHDRPIEPERESLLRMMRALAAGSHGDASTCARLMGELLDLKRADTLGKDPRCFYYVEELERMREMVRELLACGEAYSIRTLAIAGGDLIAAGVSPGPAIGALLNRALEGVLSGAVRNDAADLLAYLELGGPAA